MSNETPDVVLARIDERTRRIEEDIKKIETHYVTAEQFKGLKEKVELHQKILFGVISLLCLTVLGAMIKLVMLPHPGA